MTAEHRYKVFNKDVMEVLKGVADNSIDLVYGDPDYNVGISYGGTRYTKNWDEYIQWYGELAKESMRVLKEDGNLFFINYPKQNAYLRVRHLEQISAQVQDYVWVYNTNVGHSKYRFTTAHRSILHATKSKYNKFYKDQIAQPYKNPEDRRIKQRLLEGHKGRMPYSWFYYDLVKNVSKDKTIHSCQIPLSLVELLLKASTKENDKVFILFGGSGSEICLAREMRRDIISCEIDPLYYAMILHRLENNGAIPARYKIGNR